MSGFFSKWYLAHRLTRAWGFVIILLALLIWAKWETNIKRVEYQETTGVLLAISGTKDTLHNGKIRLPDDQEIWIALPPQYTRPKAGDRVPVIYERYDNGKIIYAFNTALWIMDGGIASQ